MGPTWKKYSVQRTGKDDLLISCYRHKISDDGKSVEFWIPKGSFIIRDGIIDTPYWTMFASFVLDNIEGYVLLEETELDVHPA